MEKRRVALWLPAKLVDQAEICAEWNGQYLEEFAHESMAAFVEALMADIKMQAERGSIPYLSPSSWQKKNAKRLHRALCSLEGGAK